jgi:hypothetical protein
MRNIEESIDTSLNGNDHLKNLRNVLENLLIVPVKLVRQTRFIANAWKAYHE